MISYLSDIVLLIFCVALLLYVLRLQRRLAAVSKILESLQEQCLKSEKANSQLQEQLHEVRTVAFGVGEKVKQLSNQIHTLNNQQAEMANAQSEMANAQSEMVSAQNERAYSDPESRLYTKAAKLVASGATVDEIMFECELPRAEAELLVNLHGGSS